MPDTVSEPGSTLAAWRLALRGNPIMLLFEFAIVGAIFFADQQHHIYLSKTPYLLVLGWVSMALRGVGWRDLGLDFTPHWQRLALELFITQPLLVVLTGHFPDLSDFRDVIGNGRLLLIMLAGSWILAALGEELVWRGYLLNRAADLFGRSAPGWTAALLLVSLAFGTAHAYQGVTGVVENTVAGVLFGLMYLACDRTLIVPIVAHGITDSLDSLLLFSGHYPGMS
jgi:membrane protease YdiL (CAAX protease family)